MISTTNYFQVIYNGRSYSLQKKWHYLERDKIEYAIDLMVSGEFNTLTESLKYVSE